MQLVLLKAEESLWSVLIVYFPVFNSTVLLQPLAGSGLHTHSQPCLAFAEPRSTLACASIVPSNQPGAALLLHLLPLDISSPNRPVALMLFSLIIAVIIAFLAPALVPVTYLTDLNLKMTTKKSRRVVFQRKLEAPSKERGEAGISILLRSVTFARVYSPKIVQ